MFSLHCRLGTESNRNSQNEGRFPNEHLRPDNPTVTILPVAPVFDFRLFSANTLILGKLFQTRLRIHAQSSLNQLLIRGAQVGATCPSSITLCRSFPGSCQQVFRTAFSPFLEPWSENINWRNLLERPFLKGCGDENLQAGRRTPAEGCLGANSSAALCLRFSRPSNPRFSETISILY